MLLIQQQPRTSIDVWGRGARVGFRAYYLEQLQIISFRQVESQNHIFNTEVSLIQSIAHI